MSQIDHDAQAAEVELEQILNELLGSLRNHVDLSSMMNEDGTMRMKERQLPIDAPKGCKIHMYGNEPDHHVPHIHVYVQQESANYSIDTGELLVGELPKSCHKSVQVWIDKHRPKLEALWRTLRDSMKGGSKHFEKVWGDDHSLDVDDDLGQEEVNERTDAVSEDQ